MKKLLFICLSLSFLIVSCKDDDPFVPVDAELHHDGDNNTAPSFDPMTVTAAARFAAGVTNEYTGKNLVEINFHMTSIPNKCVVKVFGEGTQGTPGAELYSQDVTNSIEPGEWNTHKLSTPVEITGQDIWLAVEVTHDQALQTIGCDFGPAVTGGDWVFTETENRWLTFLDLTTTESINWNIRGQIE